MIDMINVYAVVLIGGKGKRLAPLSTEDMPKAFLSVTKDRKSMFRRTIDRLTKLIPHKNIIVVANKSHSELVRRDAPEIGRNNILLEPVSRNTAPAIFLAASTLKKESGDAVIVVLPTDQYITDEDKYVDAVGKGIDFVKNNSDAIVVIGIRPDHPETGFGYVRMPDNLDHSSKIFKVEEFTEKPDLEVAEEYLRSGKYLWNTGAFIFKADTLLREIGRFAPDISVKMDFEDLERSYKDVPDISIDYAVIENADNVYCAEGAFGWMDMGSFDNLKKILVREGREFVEKDGKVMKII